MIGNLNFETIFHIGIPNTGEKTIVIYKINQKRLIDNEITPLKTFLINKENFNSRILPYLFENKKH